MIHQLRNSQCPINEHISFQLQDGHLHTTNKSGFFCRNSFIAQPSAASFLASGDDYTDMVVFQFGQITMMLWLLMMMVLYKTGMYFEWADNYDVHAMMMLMFQRWGMQLNDCTLSLATVANNSCVGVPGCMDEFYMEYNSFSGCNDQSLCNYLENGL